MDEIDSIGSSRIESGGGGDSGTVPDFYILEAKKFCKGIGRIRIRVNKVLDPDPNYF